MNVTSHFVYVLTALVAMVAVGMLLGEVGNSREISFAVMFGLIMPASMVLAGRVGRLTSGDLIGAGLALWVLAWGSIFLILRNLVVSSGSSFALGATHSLNWTEMLSSLVVFIGGSLLWRAILQRAAFTGHAA